MTAEKAGLHRHNVECVQRLSHLAMVESFHSDVGIETNKNARCHIGMTIASHERKRMNNCNWVPTFCVQWLFHIAVVQNAHVDVQNGHELCATVYTIDLSEYVWNSAHLVSPWLTWYPQMYRGHTASGKPLSITDWYVFNPSSTPIRTVSEVFALNANTFSRFKWHLYIEKELGSIRVLWKPEEWHAGWEGCTRCTTVWDEAMWGKWECDGWFIFSCTTIFLCKWGA